MTAALHVPAPFILADGTDEDHAFVATSWIQSYWEGPCVRTYMRRGVYIKGQRQRIQRVLQRSSVLIARPDDDWREGILGYVVFEAGALHWWLVKKPWRRQGIGRALLDGALGAAGRDAVYTHQPRGTMAEALWRRGVYYDPYRLET